MRILVVDDTPENMEAAKQAIANFPEHEFRFTASASEALAELPEADAVITDLFFPDEHWDTQEIPVDLSSAYQSYLGCFFAVGGATEKIVNGYIGRHRRSDGCEIREALLELLETGSIRRRVEQLAAGEFGQPYRVILQNLPAPQFPYGAAVMLEAKRRGLRSCLVSNIHRHETDCADAATTMHGVLLLAPLVEAGILTESEVQADGVGSLTYIGQEALWEANASEKTDPAAWKAAIENVLKQ